MKRSYTVGFQVYVKTMEMAKNSVVIMGWRKQGVDRLSNVQSTAATLCDTVMVNPCFIKPTECTTPRINPNTQCELRVIVMYLCRFISSNKCDRKWSWRKLCLCGTGYVKNLCTFCLILYEPNIVLTKSRIFKKFWKYFN
jgi:hypothetical protein